VIATLQPRASKTAVGKMKEVKPFVRYSLNISLQDPNSIKMQNLHRYSLHTTLWGEPERVHVQNMEQLHANDCHQNVTQAKKSTHMYTGTVSQA